MRLQIRLLTLKSDSLLRLGCLYSQTHAPKSILRDVKMQSRSIGLVDAGSQGDALLTERSPDKCLPGIWGEFAALLSLGYYTCCQTNSRQFIYSILVSPVGIGIPLCCTKSVSTNTYCLVLSHSKKKSQLIQDSH